VNVVRMRGKEYKIQIKTFALVPRNFLHRNPYLLQKYSKNSLIQGTSKLNHRELNDVTLNQVCSY